MAVREFLALNLGSQWRMVKKFSLQIKIHHEELLNSFVLI